MHCTTLGSAEGARCRDEHSGAVRSAHDAPFGRLHKSLGMPCARHESGAKLSLMLHHDDAICQGVVNKMHPLGVLLIEQEPVVHVLTHTTPYPLMCVLVHVNLWYLIVELLPQLLELANAVLTQRLHLLQQRLLS